MKITLRALENKARSVNPLLRVTPYGVAVERVRDDIAVYSIPRKPGGFKVLEFTGAAREVDAFLSGLLVGVAKAQVRFIGPDEQDGCDAC